MLLLPISVYTYENSFTLIYISLHIVSTKPQARNRVVMPLLGKLEENLELNVNITFFHNLALPLDIWIILTIYVYKR